MDQEIDLYAQIVRIAGDYFGPAAQRFIDRILHNHLHKTPQDVTPEDIPRIVRWVKLTVAMITEDQEAIEEFVNRLLQLRNPGKRG